VKKLAAFSFTATLIAGMWLIVRPLPAHAAANIFVISSLGDAPDASAADGACVTASGDCTLRAAIQQANADPAGSGDEIDFGVPGQVDLGTALPDLANSMFITGVTSKNTVHRRDGTGNFRIFNVTNGATVDIDNINVSNGYVTSTTDVCGGGIKVGQGTTLRFRGGAVTGNTAPTYGGGGICSNGATTITNSTIALNVSNNGVGGGIQALVGSLSVTDSTILANTGGDGGGLGNVFAVVTILRDTVQGNLSSGASANPFVLSHGGGGVMTSSGNTDIVNSTIASNAASAGSGGGVLNADALTRIINSTIAGNTAPTGGGLDDENGTSDTVLNSLIAKNAATTSPDIRTPASSGGHNLVGNGTGGPGFVNGTNSDKVGTTSIPIDAKLETDAQGNLVIKNNGGPTNTIALLAGSPAIDAGNDSVLGALDTLTTDQRGPGFARKQGTHVDIGAFEKAPK
jgi:hypothetical protein